MLARLTATLALTLTASLATAQSMFNQFVDPVTWPQLKDRLVLISPSDSQMDRIAVEHDAYLASFESLRAGDIATYLEDTKGFGPLTADDADDGRRAAARASAIRADIAKIDEAFYDRVAALLGEGQHAGLDRLRQRRERDRLRLRSSALVVGIQAPTHEPGDAVSWGELTENDRKDLEHTVAAWEDRYTRLLKGWASASDRSQVTFIEVIAQLNARQKDFSPEHPPTPEEIQGLMSLFQSAQKEVLGQLTPHIDRIQDHIVAGTTKMADRMPLTLQFDFVRAATSGSYLPNRVSAWVEAARRRDVDASTIAQLQHIREAWEMDAVPLMIESLEATWADESAAQLAMQQTTESGNIAIEIPTAEHVRALRERWTARHDEALADMQRLIPEQLAADLKDDADNAAVDGDHTTSHSSTMVVVAGGSDETDGDGAVVVSSSVSTSDGDWPDQFDHLMTIPRIRDETIEGISRDLSLSEAAQIQLRSLHTEHEAARLAMETARTGERRSEQARMKAAMEGESEPSQAMMMDMALIMMQPISREGLDELDAAFFRGVGELTENPDGLEPWRLARVRELATGGGGMMSASLGAIGVPDHRWSADLFTLVEACDLTDQDRAAALAAMEAWHHAATDAILNIRDAEDRLEEGMRAMMNMSEGSGKVEIDVQAAMKVEQLNAEVQKEHLGLSELTQATMDAMAAQVSDAHTLRRAWLKAAFPDIASVDAFLKLYARAADTADLTDDQRAAIAMLQAEHVESWWDATEEAVAILSVDRAPPANQQEAFFEGQRIRQEVDRHTFARREAALKRIEHLRTILNHVQLTAADGLADPPEAQGLAMPF